MLYRMGRRTLCFWFPGVWLLLISPGCLATRAWVTDQLTPQAGRVSGVETRLNQTDAKVNSALDHLEHLQLETRFILNLEGTTFASHSAALTPKARRQIDEFLSDLPFPQDAIFLVAGHTDRTGPADANYELGQKRAASVARYLITQKGIALLQVHTASYGANAPVADNTSQQGRRKNRRVEILVYREMIVSGEATPRTETHGPERSSPLPDRQ
jgi:peptidoglycan-associated lipoprotein